MAAITRHASTQRVGCPQVRASANGAFVTGLIKQCRRAYRILRDAKTGDVSEAEIGASGRFATMAGIAVISGGKIWRLVHANALRIDTSRHGTALHAAILARLREQRDSFLSIFWQAVAFEMAVRKSRAGIGVVRLARLKQDRCLPCNALPIIPVNVARLGQSLRHACKAKNCCSKHNPGPGYGASQCRRPARP